MKLFQTNRKGAVLTEAGGTFLQDAQGILAQTDLIMTHMQQFAQRDRAEIRIAYTYSLTNAYVPRLLKGFLGNEGKGCVIYSDEMPSDQIAQQPQNRIINNAGASNSILITKTYWSPSSKTKNPAC